MSFYNEIEKYRDFDFKGFLSSVTKREVEKILLKDNLSELDFLALISKTAESFIEDMAKKSHQLTKQYFGNIIVLFTPIYVSNYCTNNCVYCSFQNRNKIERKHLNFDDIRKEAKKISETGLKHILFLTGDAPKIADINYLKETTLILKEYFTSIGIEIYALSQEEYKILIDAGVDLLTIYQETYNEELYKKLHTIGPKKDYKFRLEAPERALNENIRAVGVGSLLGLDDWRKDAFFTALHASYLQNKFLSSEISVSLPRIRPNKSSFESIQEVSDKNLVQIMTATRLFLPRVGITISTRESESFRNNVVKLGVTKMSAESVTSVGGHTNSYETNSNQFDICDERGVKEMERDLIKLGYQAVYKDWQYII